MTFSSPAALSAAPDAILTQFSPQDLQHLDDRLRASIELAQATYQGISVLDKAQSGFCCTAWVRLNPTEKDEPPKGSVEKQPWGITLQGGFSIRTAREDNLSVAYLQSPLSQQLLHKLFTAGWLPRFVHKPYTDTRGYSNSGCLELHLRAPRVGWSGTLPCASSSSEDRFPTPQGLGIESNDASPELEMLLFDDCLRTAVCQAFAAWQKLAPIEQQATGHSFTACETLNAWPRYEHRKVSHYKEARGCRFTAKLLLGEADEASGTAYLNSPLYRKVQAELVAAGWEIRSAFKPGYVGDDGEMFVWYCGSISLEFAAPGSFGSAGKGQRGWSLGLLSLFDFSRKA